MSAVFFKIVSEFIVLEHPNLCIVGFKIQGKESFPGEMQVIRISECEWNLLMVYLYPRLHTLSRFKALKLHVTVSKFLTNLSP